jgi:nucleoid DNA-binding protein
MSSERITADVWSALEVMEGLKPVTCNTLGGVKALAHQGASLEAGLRPEKVKAAGSIQGGAAPESITGSVEWESMWDEVINGISDGRKLNTEDAKRLVQLKEKAVKTMVGFHKIHHFRGFGEFGVLRTKATKFTKSTKGTKPMKVTNAKPTKSMKSTKHRIKIKSVSVRTNSEILCECN